MLPSEAGSRPAGFNLLPRVTVGVAGIEPAAARIQAEMSTNDLHPDGQSGWNRTSMTVLPRHVDNHCPTLCRRSLELESNEPLSRFRRALSPGQLSRDGGTPPARGGVANICCRGRNRTCGRQSNNLPSVPAHKPYKIRGRPNAGRPHAYTGDRHALHCAPSRRFRIVRDRGHTCALGSGAPLRTYFERLRATCQR